MIMGIQVDEQKYLARVIVINIEYEICNNFISIMQFHAF